MPIHCITVATPKVEAFYWTAITFSQTLGTALGDWIADTGGLGYEGGALVFGAGLAFATEYARSICTTVRTSLGSHLNNQHLRRTNVDC